MLGGRRLRLLLCVRGLADARLRRSPASPAAPLLCVAGSLGVACDSRRVLVCRVRVAFCMGINARVACGSCSVFKCAVFDARRSLGACGSSTRCCVMLAVAHLTACERLRVVCRGLADARRASPAAPVVCFRVPCSRLECAPASPAAPCPCCQLFSCAVLAEAHRSPGVACGSCVCRALECAPASPAAPCPCCQLFSCAVLADAHRSPGVACGSCCVFAGSLMLAWASPAVLSCVARRLRLLARAVSVMLAVAHLTLWRRHAQP
ncbi:hypothetical protein B0H17DRAFT_702140 [Mycena rosella]|uniref:Uncharacterized protein n=1 Tax=Mycena rosella TaxID=1033263 RepID=A0AAD7B7J5_MYCRO|nr:hypothetical protein B0H17DRAFT_702140 [Mycena rosella]